MRTQGPPRTGETRVRVSGVTDHIGWVGGALGARRVLGGVLYTRAGTQYTRAGSMQARAGSRAGSRAERSDLDPPFN